MPVILQAKTDEFGFGLSPEVPGELMSRLYIRFKVNP
jgi:hypothetical protein